jgi:crotonobetaine/carnitine-CoA ligase
MHEGALRWADALDRLGVRAGEPVVTLFAIGFDSVFSWLGCGWLGAIEAPINTAYKGAWLTHVITNTRAHVVLTDGRFVQQLADIADGLPDVKAVVVFGETQADLSKLPFRILTDEEFLSGAQPNPRNEPGPWDISALIYTSGTTGLSKAVMVPWGQFRSMGNSGSIPDLYRKGGVAYCPYPPHHVTGKGGISSVPIHDGRVVLRERFSTDEFWNDVRNFGCTNATVLGPMAQFLMARPTNSDDADNPLQAVMMVPVIPQVEEFQERFGLKAFTCYNMTEINVPITAPDRKATSENCHSCGHPRPGVEVRVVDEHDQRTPPNMPGELIVRGEPWELNLGYWNMADKTVEAWRNGWFHTGDTFKYDEDGNYYFVDRAKDYIRRRGENISSFEVETCVNAHPNIIESAAVAVPSEQGEDEVKIAVIVKQDRSFDEADLIQFLIPRMPRFAIPRYVEIWKELPKTEATQRIQKAKVRDAGISERTWDRIAAGVNLSK